MKAFALMGGLLLATAALAQPTEFRDHRLARIDDPLRVQFEAALDSAAMRQAIAAGAAATGWQVGAESPGRAELERRIANKHTMRVLLAYEPRGYTVRYLDSINMLYDDKAMNMRGFTHRAIHKNYNIWIRQLAEAIDNAAGATTATVGGARRNAADIGLPAPLPERVEIVPPGSDAAPQAAAYSGMWAGTWGTSLQHILVVQRVEGRKASLLYCWGTNAATRDPGCSHETGTVGEDGVLRAMFKGASAQVSYRASGDGRSLQGEYERKGRVTFGTFEKLQAAVADRSDGR